MTNKLYFLSGFPYSGSETLQKLLAQNLQIQAVCSNKLFDSVGKLTSIWCSNNVILNQEFDQKNFLIVISNIIEELYKNNNHKIIIDSHIGWADPVAISVMARCLQHPVKIISAVRSIPECVEEIVNVANPKNINDFIYSAKILEDLKLAYGITYNGYKTSPESFCFVDYDDLSSNPQAQLEKIHDFLEIPRFQYNVSWVQKPKIQSNPKDVLGHHYAGFCQPEFWRSEPKTIPQVHDLDLQLAASISGDFKKGLELVNKLEREEPDNHRAAFNRGWYALRNGEIQKGYKLLDRGRIVGVFGNKLPRLASRPWDGESKGIVLLYLEGGLGDQIHQIRYAKPIADRGCKVIVSCSRQLGSLLSGVDGVSAVVDHEAVVGVYHDFYVHGMSAIVPLGFELPDISGKPYIPMPKIIKGSRKRIGLRWQGNSQFEAEHHKKFPHQLMFDAVQDIDAEFVSLQRDEGEESRPSWVKPVPLDTWEHTRQAIASCDLVISSCTSVSHLAAAMGIKTWVVIPVMPYFLYAIDGQSCPYYDSMTLVRQQVYGDWAAPFKWIKQKLKAEV